MASKNEISEQAEFMKLTRGVLAHKVAWALNAMQHGVDFSGCSKSHMATAWGKRLGDAAYASLKKLTFAELEVALAKARNGERVTPTQKVKEMLFIAQSRAAHEKKGAVVTSLVAGVKAGSRANSNPTKNTALVALKKMSDAYAKLTTSLAIAEAQIGALMNRLLKPGMTIQRKIRGNPYWLQRVTTIRGNDRGTNTFVIVSLVAVAINPSHPELSTWSCEAIPISEKTGKPMDGSSHGADGNKPTVRLTGDIAVDHPTIDMSEIFLKVIAQADAAGRSGA